MRNAMFDLLNRDCHCIHTDSAALDMETRRALGALEPGLPTWAGSNVFAQVPVFVSPEDVRIMRDVVSATGTLVQSATYRETALARAAAIARHPVAPRGVFFGYDFHLSESGPALIEINTNAGGAMLNLLLARAQKPCCEEVNQFIASAERVETLDAAFTQMFLDEWSLARGTEPLKTIAIVDDVPEQQFLYPEFLLFRQLFRRAGFEAFICAPEQLRWDSSGLFYGSRRIDLVYNRLVDFALEEPAHSALREAYLCNAIVLTPHPQAHAVLADKRNLITLRDPELHESAGLSPSQSDVLRSQIPETRRVQPEDAEQLWSERKQWFFKPVHGYGSKGAYRGDKLTRSTFERILGLDYVAQRIVTPSQRHVVVQGENVPLKLDIRCFVYNGSVQLIAARLYNGQTTNFRTAGGGFASVFTAAPNLATP